MPCGRVWQCLALIEACSSTFRGEARVPLKASKRSWASWESSCCLGSICCLGFVGVGCASGCCLGSICTGVRRVVVWARFVIWASWVSGVRRIVVWARFSFEFVRLGLVVFGSGLGVLVGGSIGCVGRWVETVLTVRSYGRVGPGVRTLGPRWS